MNKSCYYNVSSSLICFVSSFLRMTDGQFSSSCPSKLTGWDKNCGRIEPLDYHITCNVGRSVTSTVQNSRRLPNSGTACSRWQPTPGSYRKRCRRVFLERMKACVFAAKAGHFKYSQKLWRSHVLLVSLKQRKFIACIFLSTAYYMSLDVNVYTADSSETL